MTNALVTVETTSMVVAKMAERVGHYAEQSQSSATRRAYASDFAAFHQWCGTLGTPSMPSSPEVVASYLSTLADMGRKASGIERALAAIVGEHRRMGHEWPKGHAGITSVLRGIRREKGTKQNQKAPVLGADLERLCASLAGDALGVRDRSILTLGWAGAFRRSELAALETGDVVFVAEGALVTLKRSKTDQEGKGSVKAIPFFSSPAVCPVRALKAWLEILAGQGITEGPLFRSVNRWGKLGASLDGQSIALVVKRSAKNVGLEEGKLGAHSRRAGVATEAAKKGRGLDASMRQTGHKSERVARGYIRMATAFEGNAAIGLL